MRIPVSLTRRDLIAGSCSFLLCPPQIAMAQSASPEETIRLTLLTFDGARRLYLLPEDRLAAAYRVLVEAVAAGGRNTQLTPSEIERITNETTAKGRDYFQRLETTITSTLSTLPLEMPKRLFERNGAQALEGHINSKAEAALWIAAIAAKGESELSRRISTACAHGEVLGGARRLLTSLSTDEKFKPLLSSPAFKRITSFDAHVPMQQLISAFPPRVTNILEDLRQAGNLQGIEGRLKERLSSALHSHIAGALREARTEIDAIRRLIETSGINAGSQSLTQLAKLSTNTQVVGAIGQFVFAQLFKDTHTANRIAAGMQVAQAVMQIGMVFSTGGLGAIGGVSAVLSALGPLNGMLGSGQQDPNTELLKEISAQIETLRREMHERFDRLEQLSGQILSKLDALARDLRRAEIRILDRIDDVGIELRGLNRYARRSDRDTMLVQFFLTVDRARSTDASPEGVLIELMGHARYKSSHVAFINTDETASLRETLESTPSIDLALGLLGKGAALLGLPPVAAITHNPIEWARGTNAYLEAQLRFPTVQSDVIRQGREELLVIGSDLREKIAEATGEARINLACDKLERAGKEFSGAIKTLINESMFSDSSRRPHVGRFPLPIGKIGGPVKMRQLAGVSDAIYMTNYAFLDSDFVQVGDDPLKYGIGTGRLRLELDGGKAVTQTIRRGENEIEIRLGTLRTGSVKNDRGEVVFAPMKVWEVRTEGLAFDAWLVQPTGSFFEQISAALSEDQLILEWLGRPASFDRIKTDVKVYSEIAAAFCLLGEVVSWRITNELDDPLRGAIGSHCLKNIDEARDLLAGLVTGVSWKEIDLIPQYLRDLALKRNPWVRRPPQIATTADEDPLLGGGIHVVEVERSVKWTDLDVHLDFAALAEGVIQESVLRATTALKSIMKNLNRSQSVALVDRVLLKLEGLRAYGVS